MRLIRRYKVAREIAIERMADKFTEGIFFTKWLTQLLPEWVYYAMLLLAILGGGSLVAMGLFVNLPTIFIRFIVPVWQELHQQPQA
jgi:hypothetical protein